MFLSRMFVTVTLTSVFKVIPEGHFHEYMLLSVLQVNSPRVTSSIKPLLTLNFVTYFLHFVIQRNKQTKMNEFNLINFKNCLLSRYNHIAVSRTLCARKPYSMILGSRSILLSWSYVQSFINSYNNRLTFDSSYISIVR